MSEYFQNTTNKSSIKHSKNAFEFCLNELVPTYIDQCLAQYKTIVQHHANFGFRSCNYLCTTNNITTNIMGRNSSIVAALLLACFALASWQVQASDPELITDFFVPPGVNESTLNGTFFTSTVLRNIQAMPGNFATVTPLNVLKFTALNGLGVSSALLQFPPGTVNVPHTHPRGTELLLVLEGTLDVGLIDTTDKLFTQTLVPGDSFAFPKGLVHFQINYSPKDSVVAVSAFSSSNPGLVKLPNTLFGSHISDGVLAESFGVSSKIIDQLEAATVV